MWGTRGPFLIQVRGQYGRRLFDRSMLGGNMPGLLGTLHRVAIFVLLIGGAIVRAVIILPWLGLRIGIVRLRLALPCFWAWNTSAL